MTEPEQHQQSALPLADTVAARLAEATLPEPVKALLRDALDSGAHTGAATPSGRVFLEAVTVNGFRGIGPQARLGLKPRPGVNLVVGRNGSGKTSVAESIEVAFTGARSSRQGRNADRDSQWYNLHDGNAPKIELRLAIEGDQGRSTLTRSWPGTELDGSQAVFKRPGHGTGPLSGTGWERAAVDHRPFLSHDDLHRMLKGSPSARYDTIATILGMEQLSLATNELKAREKALADTARQVREALPGLKEALYALEDDDRAAQALIAVDVPDAPDLDSIDSLVAGLPAADAGRLAELQAEAAAHGPDLEQVGQAVHRLRLAVADLDDVRSTDAERARLRADLLEMALVHADRHPGDDSCPTCGAQEAIGPKWYEDAARQVEELRAEAKSAEDARAAVRSGVQALHRLIHRPARTPASLAGPWEVWMDCRDITEPVELARSAEQSARVLAEACATVRRRAADELAERDERWRAFVTRLAAWAEQARAVARDKILLGHLRKALNWLKALSTELREQRMERFSRDAQRIWELLRQESNVGLTSVNLRGSEKATVRQLVMSASVDGKDAPALDVMSAGEQHSLALALFLPRASTEDSPFGFLVIDDPVQSMDPTKVHGLAQVLHELGKRRQVVVFTHDTRLQKAFTDQELPVTVFQVTRGEESRVKVECVSDPVARAIDDARAIALTSGLPPATYDHVLPGLCRIALENAFLEAAWIRHHRAGGKEHVLQAALDKAERLSQVAALALFGDLARTADVGAEIERRWGRQERALIQQCQRGAHPGGVSVGDPLRFVSHVEALTMKIRKPEATA
ncbi:AAA family ATPase [Kitasatospora sp. NPDC001540]|uniref:AAA family ATPase n=1 Tax=Kitasatospora sp. NPDC001540 TaxID=3364014 RepID=UPI0036A4FF56